MHVRKNMRVNKTCTCVSKCLCVDECGCWGHRGPPTTTKTAPMGNVYMWPGAPACPMFAVVCQMLYGGHLFFTYLLTCSHCSALAHYSLDFLPGLQSWRAEGWHCAIHIKVYLMLMQEVVGEEIKQTD